MSANDPKEPNGRAARAYAIRVAGLYAGMFAVFGTAMPYLSPWFVARGLSAADVAILATVPLLVRSITTPVIAFHADRNHTHRGLLILMAAIAVAGWGAMTLTHAFWPLMLLQVLIGFTNAMMPLTETIAMRGVRQHGIDYGRMRLWGSVTFICTTLLAGLVVARLGIESMMLLIIASALATLVATIALPPHGEVISADGAPRQPLSIANAVRLLADPALIVLLLANSAVQASHAMLYTFGTLDWQAKGLTADWIGALWATSVTAEIALFAVAGAYLKRYNAGLVLGLGAAAAVLRWLLVAADPSLPALFLLQTLHAFSFGASHLGAIYALAAIVPPDRLGTASALASVANAMAFGLATPLAGYVFQRYASAGYLPMAVLAAVACIASLALAHRLRQTRT